MLAGIVNIEGLGSPKDAKMCVDVILSGVVLVSCNVKCINKNIKLSVWSS